MPPRIWLQRVRTTILDHSPASVSISVLNSGQALIGFATLIVHVAGHSYTRRTPPLDPGKVATDTDRTARRSAAGLRDHGPDASGAGRTGSRQQPADLAREHSHLAPGVTFGCGSPRLG